MKLIVIAHIAEHTHLHVEDAAAFVLCAIVIAFFILLDRRTR